MNCKIINTYLKNITLNFIFYRFVIIGAIIQIINLVIICYATSNKTKNTSPIIEEKGNGAIMLYWSSHIFCKY